MAREQDAELKNIKSNLIRVQVIGLLGTALLGVALYGLFGERNERLLFLFDNKTLTGSIFFLGFTIIFWQFTKIAALQKKQRQIMRNNQTENGI